MLAYILAIAVGLGSLGIYLAAFFLPEVHRKSDFYWSGVGLFYALMLWVCAGRLTGGVLLGQIAAVSLLGWFCWQTLTLRRVMVPSPQQTDLPTTGELQSKVGGLLTSVKAKIQGTVSGVKSRKPAAVGKTQPPKVGTTQAKTEAAPPVVPPPSVEQDWVSEDETVIIIDRTGSTPTTKPTPFEAIANPESPSDELPDLIPPHPPSPDIVQEAIEDAHSKNIPTSPPPTAEQEFP